MEINACVITVLVTRTVTKVVSDYNKHKSENHGVCTSYSIGLGTEYAVMPFHL